MQSHTNTLFALIQHYITCMHVCVDWRKLGVFAYRVYMFLLMMWDC